MKISEIIFKVTPWDALHIIELHCKMIIDGEEFNWKEALPDSDFESRAEKYLNFMTHSILNAIKGKKK